MSLKQNISESMVFTLDDDIVVAEILPKLPPKSLLRFKCVCKSWLALISSPKFTNIHLLQSLSSKSNRLVFFHVDYYQDSLVSVEIDMLGNHTAKIPLYQDFSFLMGEVRNRVHGSCNGLLCFESRNGSGGVDLVVLNPSTKIFRKISLRDSSRMIIGFGYDRDTDDYKIVRLPLRFRLGDPYTKFKVFSLKCNNWTNVEDTSCQGYLVTNEGALIHGHLLHWAFASSFEQGGQYWIGCFDICSERWIDDVPLPNDDQSPTSIRGLRAVDGCLCMMASYGEQYVIWLMKEYGMKESWVKLWVTTYSTLYPIAIHKLSDCKILLHSHFTKERPFWYNTRDSTIERLYNPFVIPCRWFDICACVQSLVSIPGGEKIYKNLSSQQVRGRRTKILTEIRSLSSRLIRAITNLKLGN